MPSARPARFLALTASLCGVAAASLLSGCYAPGGGLNPVTGGAQTIQSTARAVKVFQILDTRSNEAVFSLEIPVGKQFTYQFIKDRGDDPVNRPDLMKYQLFDIGKTSGRLRNGISVPDGYSRLVTWDYVPGQYYEEPPPSERYRIDKPGDKPAWWSPKGGPIPEDDARQLYDG